MATAVRRNSAASTAQYAHKRELPTAPRHARKLPSAVVKPPLAQPARPPPLPPPLPPPALPPPRPPPVAAPRPPSPPPPAVVAAPAKAKPTIESLKPPKRFVPPSALRPTISRPSLSDQLAAIRDQGANILDGIQKTFNVGDGVGASSAPPLCTLNPRSVRVGVRVCDWPGTLKLFDDRAEYHFLHPKHRNIRMLMRYRDMTQLSLNRGARTLTFRIEHSLEYFGDEYNHFDPNHHLDISLGAPGDLEALTASAAWARMQAGCASRR